MAKKTEEKNEVMEKLIALTNQGSEADKKHAEELGVNRYVIKATMIPSEVVAMVKEVLGIK